MVECREALWEEMQVVSEEIERREQGAVSANASDQREEFGAVRDLTLKIATDRSVQDGLHPSLDLGQVASVDGDGSGQNVVSSGGHRVTLSNSSQEFEFSLSGGVADEAADDELDGISPADDLFFKGQLLPLNLPTRLQMVQRLSSPKRPGVVGKETPSIAPAVPTPTVAARLFDPESLKCSSIGDESSACLGSALVNSRSSSFHSQGSHNFWESDSPGELDSGDCTSSRDSSGSSQDTCSESEKRAGVPKLFQDHSRSASEVLALGRGGRALLYGRQLLDGRSCKVPPQGEKPQISSWLRSSFRWKVFFGLKKPSRFSFTEVGGAAAAAERGDQCEGKVDNVRRDSKEFSSAPFTSKCGHPQPTAAGPPSACPDSKCSCPIACAHCKTELQNVGDCVPREAVCVRELEFSAENFSFPGADAGVSYREAAAAVAPLPGESMGSARPTAPFKSREGGVHKYFNILIPSLNGRFTARPAGQTCESSVKAIPILRTKSSFSGDLMVHSFSTRDASSTAAQSKSETSLKPAAAAASLCTASAAISSEHPRSRSPTSHSLASNLRIPSFSRGSKTSSTAGRSSNPSHSGPLTSSSPSTMAEFQSSIQGAIAHCKQSQSVGK